MTHVKGEKHIGRMIKCLDNKIVRTLNKDFEKFDLTVVQHEVLAYLYFNESRHEIYQKELEEYLQYSNPTVTGIVKRLEMKELIYRTPGCHDARCKKLMLTERGMDLFKETLQKGPKALEKKMTRYLNTQEITVLIELLDKVIKGLDEDS